MATVKRMGLRYRFAKRAVKNPVTSAPVVRFNRSELENAISSPSSYAGMFGMPEQKFVSLLKSINERLSHMKRLNRSQDFLRFKLGEGKELMLRLSAGKKGTLSIRQVPLIHTITSFEKWKSHEDPYESLKRILKTGFIGQTRPNAKFREKYDAVTSVSLGKGRYGDRYRIELLAPFESSIAYSGDYYIAGARPNQISSVVVELPRGLSAEEQAKRKKMYKEELKEFGLPIKFNEK